MGEFSPIHWLIVLAVILLLFGGRKIPELAKGLGEGIRSFKDGIAGGTATATTPVPPSTAPPGLTAKPGKGQISLSWGASVGASSYNVKRTSTSGGPYALIASTAATNHSDEGLNNGTYYYVVSSVGANGESANSIEVTCTLS